MSTAEIWFATNCAMRNVIYLLYGKNNDHEMGMNDVLKVTLVKVLQHVNGRNMICRKLGNAKHDWYISYLFIYI